MVSDVLEDVEPGGECLARRPGDSTRGVTCVDPELLRERTCDLELPEQDPGSALRIKGK